MASGGKRVGAGRKACRPEVKRVQMVISIAQETRETIMDIYKETGDRPGRIIDNLIKLLNEKK